MRCARPALAVCLLVLATCGFGEEADPPFTSSLDKDIVLADLDPEQVATFCQEYRRYITTSVSLDELCTYAGVLQVKTQGGDTSDCQARYQECLDTPWDPSCRLSAANAAGCPATLGQAESCISAEALELLRLIKSVNCVDVTVSLDIPRPMACSELETACPGFFD
jgi:hypothetical protein